MKSPILISLFYQVAVVIPATFSLLWFDQILAYSFVLGALVYCLPNLYFTIYAFRYRGAHMAPWITKSFSWGESGKLALAAVGFALVFRFVENLSVMSLFAGFCSLIVTQWLIGRKVAEDMQLQTEQLEKN